jgi:hypothetical protein
MNLILSGSLDGLQTISEGLATRSRIDLGMQKGMGAFWICFLALRALLIELKKSDVARGRWNNVKSRSRKDVETLKKSDT